MIKNLIIELKSYKHFIGAIFANIYYFFPSKSLTLIGVTGTDGKTTTVMMIYHILKKSNTKVGFISTVASDMGEGKTPTGFHITTPDCWQLQKLLKKAKKNGLTHMILEASSHGLKQHRLLGCHFTVGAITNITSEHLDYHGTYQKYLKAKAKLLSLSETKILNKDDSSYKTLSCKFPEHTSFSHSKSADFNFKNTPVKLKQPSSYNNSNALVAIAICQSLGINRKTSTKHLESFLNPPGRFEVIQQKPFKVIIDFAHTPNGLKNVLSAIKIKEGKLIHIFGSAGERDKYKRPIMGSISAKFADIIILTAEDPRSEKVVDINQAIKKGIPKTYKGKIIEEPDRAKAIKLGILSASKNDTVIITGKGPEVSMSIKGVEYPWNEKKIILQAIKLIK